MGNYVPTAATVVAQPGATIVPGFAGAAIAAGDWVYLDTATNTYKLAQANSAAASKAAGIALNSAPGVGQPVDICTAGLVSVTMTPTPTARIPLVLSGGTAGRGADAADLITNIATWFPCFLGIFQTTSLLFIGQTPGPVYTGV